MGISGKIENYILKLREKIFGNSSKYYSLCIFKNQIKLENKIN
jgi:hypothetical protein